VNQYPNVKEFHMQYPVDMVCNICA